jgi:protein tyrosine phosphatase (PTP) superfamily phosphohydrolase (DUF442 family)
MPRAASPRIAAALLASLWLAGTLPAKPAAEQIDRFLRVSDRVCTGGQPTVAQLASLKREGVRTILALRDPAEYDAEAEAVAARELELAYVNIPVRTADPKDEEVVAFLQITSDPAIFPAFIHCGSGNRVGAFWMIRRVLVDGWTVEKAEEEARRIGLRSPNLVEFARHYIQEHPAEK